MNSTLSWFKKLFLADWEMKVTILLVSVVLYQYIEVIASLKNIWLPETVRIVQYTLLLTAAIEVVVRFHWTIRRSLQVVALFWINAHFVHDDLFALLRWEKGISFQHWIYTQYQYVLQLNPQVWFVFSTWIIFLIAAWYVLVRWRMVTFIIGTVITFAVIDSYTPSHVWINAAWVVGSGLLLSVNHHFHQIKLQHPSSWKYLSSYPRSIVIPILVILTLVISLGTIAPDVAPTLQDPYTIWENWHGNQVVTSFNAKGWDIPVKKSKSGYERNTQRLGGAFDFDYSSIMKVKTDHRSYLRGDTLSLYTGKGWDHNGMVPLNRTTISLNTPLLQTPNANNNQLKTVSTHQDITVLSEKIYPVLFSAFKLHQVDQIQYQGSGDNIPALWNVSRSVVDWVDVSKYPKQYTVEAEIPVIDEAKLRKAAAKLPSSEEEKQFLQIPISLPERVKQLTEEITKNAANPYDKAKAIEQYLKTNYPYTNQPPTELGTSSDFVDSFLFQIKAGYCDYYSTAMAIMLRSDGIPSRWVKGFTSGVLPNDQNGGLIDINREKQNTVGDSLTYTVRNADAHSWVEVYFEGYGWIPFEPTAGFDLPTIEAAKQEQSKPVIATPDPKKATEQINYTWIFTAIMWLAVIALIVLLIWYVFKKWNVLTYLWQLREKRNKKSRDWNYQVKLRFNKMLRSSKRKGYTRQEYETVREMMERWAQDDLWLLRDLEPLIHLFEKAKYSDASLSHAEYEETERLIRKLKEALK